MTSHKDRVFAAGHLLKLALLMDGCKDALVEDICFAAGQRMAMLDPQDDLSEVVRSIHSRYRQGDWDTPGQELADRLLKEKFGDPINAVELLRWVRAKAAAAEVYPE